MNEDNNMDNLSRSDKKKNAKRNLRFIKIALLVILILGLIGCGIVAGLVSGAIKGIPPIDASNIDDLFIQNTYIFDDNDEPVEKVLSTENRTAESLSNMPLHLQKAFISIEDERFYSHFGVDPKAILAAFMDNIKARGRARGASTITQQLARNLYLSPRKELTRKIREAYIAIELEKQLSKDQILEAYLNKIYLGQSAYGVKEAAFTYFSKEDLNDLTIAESALVAGITQHPNRYSPYLTLKPENVPPNSTIIGDIYISGEKYVAVFNEESLSRQRVILSKMKELGHISQYEYQEALDQDMLESLVPGRKSFNDISSYFIDYVKEQVVSDLAKESGMTKEEAHLEVATGGLRIYSTINMDMQRDIEDIYSNFAKVVFNGGRGSSWRSDRSGNILDSSNRILYYKKSNILNDNNDLIIENGSYTLSDRGLTIINPKLNVNSNNVVIKDHYTLVDNNLVTHSVGSLSLDKNDFYVNDKKELIISQLFLNNASDFYTIDGSSNLIINSKYFPVDTVGIVQPQSATVVMDHISGELKAIVGGRNFEGSRILNRALAPRQPGSAIKPLAAYLPALDNSYTTASPIDDVPLPKYDNGNPGPRNSYAGYRGIIPMREAIRTSSNAASVRVVNNIGIETSKEYLKRLGIIKENEPDNFVTRLENKVNNDENLSALGLGGMTYGVTPLDMTAAFASIANNGTYVRPMAYTRVEDRYGNIILENKPKKTNVVSPQIAYVLTDMLQGVVTSGTGGRARVPGVQVAGKTGTTSDNMDAWFVGYTPKYAASVWIGNDSPSIKLPNGSTLAAGLWSTVMRKVHEGVSENSFVPPDGIVRKSVCTVSGKSPSSLCSRDPRGVVRTEIFARGTEPTGTCDVHVSARVDTISGKLAPSNFPDYLVTDRVFMKINPPYIPSQHGGIIPSDFSYRLPTQTANYNSIPPELLPGDEDDEDDDEDDEENGSTDDNNNNDEDKDKIDNIIDSMLNGNSDEN